MGGLGVFFCNFFFVIFFFLCGGGGGGGELKQSQAPPVPSDFTSVHWQPGSTPPFHLAGP